MALTEEERAARAAGRRAKGAEANAKSPIAHLSKVMTGTFAELLVELHYLSFGAEVLRGCPGGKADLIVMQRGYAPLAVQVKLANYAQQYDTGGWDIRIDPLSLEGCLEYIEWGVGAIFVVHPNLAEGWCIPLEVWLERQSPGATYQSQLVATEGDRYPEYRVKLPVTVEDAPCPESR